MGVEPTLFGGLQAGNIGLIGDYDCDFRSGNLSGSDVVGNGDEVGTTSGEEYAEFLHACLFFFHTEPPACGGSTGGGRRGVSPSAASTAGRAHRTTASRAARAVPYWNWSLTDRLRSDSPRGSRRRY